MEKYNILLVEDDTTLGYILKEYLEMNDFQVYWAKEGVKGFEKFTRYKIDICILDIMMPEKDGFTLAKEIKSTNPSIPIIFLTAKSLKIDKLKGFKIGADDYIIKPVDEEELIARIRAVLKRIYKVKEPDVDFSRIGIYLVNYLNQTLKIDNETIHLSTKEVDLLKLLIANKNKILKRKDALKELWGINDYFNRRSMDVYVSKLRKYLSKDKNIKITNIHGKGFILSDEESYPS